ncbi:hypothetical protein VTJ04DRAFT_7557 [Mycothermus thermophilus]
MSSTGGRQYRFVSPLSPREIGSAPAAPAADRRGAGPSGSSLNV